MKVIAKEVGYYGGKIREVGEEFGIAKKEHFSHVWMEFVEAETVVAPKQAGKNGKNQPVEAAEESLM
jgi:hypothetical protein